MFNLGLDLKHPWETEPKVLDKQRIQVVVHYVFNTSDSPRFISIY